MNRQITVRKGWAAFWLAEGALLVLCGAVCLLFPQSDWVSLGTFVILSAIWAVYYYRLEYNCSGNSLKISSGIVFRRHRLLPAENVLWEMRLLLPPFKRAATVVLHTSGGRAIIFGEYSTDSSNNVENSG